MANPNKIQDIEKVKKEDSTINTLFDQISQHYDKNFVWLNSISDSLNKETKDIIRGVHSGQESSSSKSSDNPNYYQNFTLSDNDNSGENLNSIITKFFLNKFKMQSKVDKNKIISNKTGRLSKYKHMKSCDIKKWLIDILHKKLINLLCNKTKEIRIDLFKTEYFRLMRKIPHYFTKDFWTQIHFKSSDISKSVIGLVEAFSAYSFAQNNFSVTDIVERVVDFSVVYFSEDKWIKLINELLITSDLWLIDTLKEKLSILQIRRKTTTLYMKEFVSKWATMRELFRIALQVLSQLLDPASNKRGIVNRLKSRNKCQKKILTRSKTNEKLKLSRNKSLKSRIFTLAQRKRAKYLHNITKEILCY